MITALRLLLISISWILAFLLLPRLRHFAITDYAFIFAIISPPPGAFAISASAPILPFRVYFDFRFSRR